MVGRFILGAIFGGVVVTGGLVIGAALFPPSQTPVAANANAGPEVSAPMEPATPVEGAEPAPQPTAEPAPSPDPTPAAVEDPALPPDPAPEAAEAPAAPAATDPAAVSPATNETAAAAEPSADSAPAPQAASEPALLAEVAPPVSDTPAEAPAPAPIAEVPAPEQPADPAQPPAPEADAAVAADGTPPPTPAPLAEAPPAPEPTPLPAPEMAPESPEAAPGTMIAEAEAEPQPPVEAPASETPDQPAPADDAPGMAPAPEVQPDPSPLPGSLASDMPGTRSTGLPGSAPASAIDETAPDAGNAASGVIVGRLPRIGDAPAPTDPAADEVADAAPADDRPLAQFAAPFENPDNKPLVAILLIDTGAADLDRAGLATLPFPVSFALDPLDPATPDHAAIYRAAGKEVVMLATGLPEGAQPADVEVAFQSMAQNLPEAVAVMDLPLPAFQNNRPLASLVVPVVQAQGRGLVTWDTGLNAADQVARREDLAATRIFRDLAAGGTDRFAIRRTLERVVFKAGQDGRVAVATAATPEMVAALLEWSIEGRGATVALAPLTAVLTVD